MSALAPEPAFAEGDAFLHLALGVRHARAEARAALDRLPAVPPEAPAEEPGAVLFAILGFVGLVDRLGAVVESWAVEAPGSPPEAAGGDTPPRLESLLR